jgi:phosphoglycerate dehydrogenase-like enzyme
MYSNHPPSQAHIERLEGLGDVHVTVADSECVAAHHAADADVILGHRYLRQTLPHTRRLKWVQSTAAGPQHLLSYDLRRINPVLTRCTIFSNMVAWHAYILALAVV